MPRCRRSLAPDSPPYDVARDIVEDAARRGDGGYFPQYAGESLGLVHDLPSAADVVHRRVDEAGAALARLVASEGPGDDR